ncbi:MAG: hypothetical protein E7406_01670 [Ruminococcaceae bacterium]|nr:hypothetical protein [Oscillospiraceae bacterium]
MKEMKLTEVINGKTFKIGDVEFIKFSEENGEVTAVAKDIAFRSQFGKNNNLKESSVLERLKNEFLPKIAEVVGEENILEHKVDLTSLDGLKTYGDMVSKISIPTFDFYRENVKIFDEYNPDTWWWLATPDTTPEHLNDFWCRCVSPDGNVNFSSNYDGTNGVRPFLKFVSSIFVSVEE